MGTPTTPSSDVCVTAPGCLGCGRQLPAGRSRRFCCPACRQAAYRRRHQPETRSPRATAWPLTVARHRLRMPRMRDPLPRRTMVPRLLTTVSAPWTRRKLPLLR